ncbi:hypothetical protein Poli38472_014655 [Pythium oligandrum]|uniref:Beta'-coat protein n=1 Tax=Pythium oligandrum TaxID=41045 RepID=A0A8K1CJR8_PYTOL|nr:hypothetical protein Poli38472_014655 [Pythium oligandrum]|eukprot:TMW63950.1 hypothetical protein Poli38472_014655 [Pythium oligandrum]
MTRFSVSQLLSTPSARVKGLDVHPERPWLLMALHDGSVVVWDYSANQLIKIFSVSASPVRSARFIARENWVAACTDDHRIRVFHLEANAEVASFVAHGDYVRDLAVHPTRPLLLSASDDRTIKSWDRSENWSCTRVFKGHGHYVMSIALRPGSSDTNVAFVSGSLDHTARLWSLDSDEALGILRGHTKGINAVAFNVSGSHVVTTSDDTTAKLWDVVTHNPVATLTGHTDNVTSAAFHPTLPLLVTGSEDQTVRLWNTETQQTETVWTQGLGRAWAVRFLVDKPTAVAIGYDNGVQVVQVVQVDEASNL